MAGVLRTPLELRRLLVYVLHDHRHHTGKDRPRGFDPMSTALSLDGSSEAP
ncbi:MAG TPA: hypothetical protein VHU80_18550 [Polyangiaceae bacterium]|nr:hypothetical protein [Polyangiaceae bacterium]